MGRKMVSFLVFLSYILGARAAYLGIVPKFPITFEIGNSNELYTANSLVDNQKENNKLFDNDIEKNERPILLPIEEEPTYEVQDNMKKDKQTSNFLAIKETFGFDLINKTTEVMKLNLQTMAHNKEGLQFLKDLMDTNHCLSNQEGYMALFKHGSRVVEISRPELEEIILNIASFREERHVSLILRKSAILLVIIENLFPKLQPITFLMQCKSSVEEGLESMRELCQIFYSKHTTEENIFSKHIKEKLLKSAHITGVLTQLMDSFQENLSQRDRITKKNFIGLGVKLVAKALKDVAEVLNNVLYLDID